LDNIILDKRLSSPPFFDKVLIEKRKNLGRKYQVLRETLPVNPEDYLCVSLRDGKALLKRRKK
jgi:hypothetical protein